MEASAYARARPQTGKKLTGMIIETAKKIDDSGAVRMVKRGQLPYGKGHLTIFIAWQFPHPR
jgi:hypothetical protein